MSEATDPGYQVNLNPRTMFLLSTSGSQTSISKHNKALQALSINLVYFTFSRPITGEQYADMLRALIIRGGAVTGQGLKSDIVPYLDELDGTARTTQAINTVINQNGVLHGYNTDAFGFETALRTNLQKAELTIQTAVVYGNGGVSGVAAHVLRSMGIRTTMAGRNEEKVIAKMEQLQLEKFAGPYDLVVNATPVSSEQLGQAPGLLDILQNARAVFDHSMPEREGKTNYLQAYCKEHDLYFIPGTDMYAAQMIKQWRLFLDGYTDDAGKTWQIDDEDIRQYWNL